MGLIEKFKGKRIFLDTSPLIYFIEGNIKYQKFLDSIFELNINRNIDFVTSSLTLIEVLVQPLRLNRLDVVEKYETILTESDTIEIIDLNISISRLAAEIRAKYNFKTPDSIQIATAIYSSSDFFLTNDKNLMHDSIEIITLEKMVEVI